MLDLLPGLYLLVVSFSRLFPPGFTSFCLFVCFTFWDIIFHPSNAFLNFCLYILICKSFNTSFKKITSLSCFNIFRALFSDPFLLCVEVFVFQWLILVNYWCPWLFPLWVQHSKDNNRKLCTREQGLWTRGLTVVTGQRLGKHQRQDLSLFPRDSKMSCLAGVERRWW